MNDIRIIDPTPSRRLPLMQTIQDAAKLNIQHRTTFYVSAYLFQAWICELSLRWAHNHVTQAQRSTPNSEQIALRIFHVPTSAAGTASEQLTTTE